ncbi:MAG: dependent oxidoreductase, partial [Actinoallomurus sp.]|nr:dependent oxidoreductase [Actinoallomurus sp.]
PDRALHIRPRPSADLVRFLLGFARHANRRRYAESAAALAGLAADTFPLFEELASLGVDGTAGKDGFLFVYGSATSARTSRESFRRLGAPTEGILGPAELTDLEPCLTAGAQAGFVVGDQWWVDPNLFVDGLAARLRGRGVEIIEGARVTRAEESAAGVRVHTSRGVVDGDVAVLAAGIWSREIGRSLGVDLNIFPGKGYSFSVEMDQVPRRLIHLGDAHVVLTPLAKATRIAGTMEFDRDHDRFDARRVTAIATAARPYLRGVAWENRTDEWTGARPMTPDGLPAIGHLPGHRNIYVASGHNMLGLTLGPATGRLVTDLLTGGTAPAAAFDPARIARRHRPPGS